VNCLAKKSFDMYSVL